MKPIVLLTLGLVLAGPALAHTDEYLDTVKAPHGGQLRMAGPHHYELVVQADGLDVYVTDHAGTASDIKGASATATVINGKTKTSVTLAPAGGNRLHGAGTFDPKARTKAVLSVSLPGQDAVQARFDLNRPAGDPHAAHKDEAGHDHSH